MWTWSHNLSSNLSDTFHVLTLHCPNCSSAHCLLHCIIAFAFEDVHGGYTRRPSCVVKSKCISTLPLSAATSRNTLRMLLLWCQCLAERRTRASTNASEWPPINTSRTKEIQGVDIDVVHLDYNLDWSCSEKWLFFSRRLQVASVLFTAAGRKHDRQGYCQINMDDTTAAQSDTSWSPCSHPSPFVSAGGTWAKLNETGLKMTNLL